MLALFTVFALVATALARPQTLHGLTFSLPTPVVQPAVAPAATSAVAPAVPAVPPANFIHGSNPDGSTVHGFQTIDGQSRSEAVLADGSVRGSYSYVDANGKPVTVNYIADQQGFRTSLDPVAPGAAAATQTSAQVAVPAATAPVAHQTIPLSAFTFPTLPATAPVAQPAPQAPVAPAAQPAVHSFTPFISPIPASTLPLSHFGFQPLTIPQATQAVAPAAAPAQAPVAAPVPFSYSFNTGTGRR